MLVTRRKHPGCGSLGETLRQKCSRTFFPVNDNLWQTLIQHVRISRWDADVSYWFFIFFRTLTNPADYVRDLWVHVIGVFSAWRIEMRKLRQSERAEFVCTSFGVLQPEFLRVPLGAGSHTSLTTRVRCKGHLMTVWLVRCKCVQLTIVLQILHDTFTARTTMVRSTFMTSPEGQ